MASGWTPPGKGTREARRFDQTSLHEHQHGRLVHRDYAAHYFRWGFAYRFCGQKRVLDVGCGPDVPLFKVLCASIPDRAFHYYLGVDLNKLKFTNNVNAHLRGEFNFVERWKELQGSMKFDVATCFEVIEHMDVPDGQELLRGIFGLLAKGGTMLLSTPVFHRKQARNHIHEFGIEELQELIEAAGFKVVQRFGTFGDILTLRKAATQAHRDTMDSLSVYYSNDVISNFLAPLYPDACKNNIWQCMKP